MVLGFRKCFNFIFFFRESSDICMLRVEKFCNLEICLILINFVFFLIFDFVVFYFCLIVRIFWRIRVVVEMRVEYGRRKRGKDLFCLRRWR